MALIEPPKDPNFGPVGGSTLSGGLVKLQPHGIRCVDQWWWEMAILSADTKLSDEKRELYALAKLLESADIRDRWSQQDRTGNTDIFIGQLVGRLGDGFIFKEGTLHFFVPASDLAPVDLRVAALACKTRQPDWSAVGNLRDLCATRMVHSTVVHVGNELVPLDGALVGAYPRLMYANNAAIKEMPLSDYTALHTARTTYQWLEENAKILSGGDNAQVADALDVKYPQRAGADVQLASLPPDRRVHVWKVAGDSKRSFKGILVGQYNRDLVFETTVSGQAKYFLAAPQVLDAESKTLAKQLLMRVEPKDWQPLLTTADNWQHYRIWFDPSRRVFTPEEPSVIESISNALIVTRRIDGTTTSQPMPFDAERMHEYTEFYEPAWAAALEVQKAAEANLSLWTFADCEPTLRAELIGDAGASLVVRDAKNAQFLVNKACLTEASLRDFMHLQRTRTDLKQFNVAEAWKMPRVWCTRTKLIGPAVPKHLTSDCEQLVLHTLEGDHEVVNISSLTLREQLSFVKEWQLQHNLVKAPPELATADSIETLSRRLNEPISRQHALQECPPLETDIQREVDAAFASWTHETWQSVEIALPADKPLIAINADATAGVVAAAERWQLIDFASGTVSDLPISSQVAVDAAAAAASRATSGVPAAETSGVPAAETSGVPAAETAEASPEQRAGPWMGSEPSEVYWVENGVLMHAKAGDSKANPVLPSATPRIAAACQTPNFEYLVFHFHDSSVRRWRIPTAVQAAAGTLEVIAPKLGRPNANGAAIKIWASRTGESIVLANGPSTVFYVKATANSPALSNFVGTMGSVNFAVVGRDSAWVDLEADSRRLSELKASTTYIRPTTQGLPFSPAWSGIVDVDGTEVLQSIGRSEDPAALGSNTNHVVFIGNTGYFEQFATQRIVGEIDDRALVAANGAAIVHWRGQQAIVSRRPAVMPTAPPLLLSAIIDRLVAQANIGQLEALARYLERPPSSLYGRNAGWLNIKFHELVKTALFNYQPHLGGDRLGRAMQLANRFLVQYPHSQVAATALADIERDLAWSARGGGYAGSVTEAGSEAFRVHMQSAAKQLEPLLADDAMAGTLRSLIDVAMATGQLELAGQVARHIETSQHIQNCELHQALAFLLLPRWYGSDGSAEAYRDKVAKQLGGAAGDIMYAELVVRMWPAHGVDRPLSSQLTIDLQRVLDGTLAYYQTGTNSELIDTVILLMSFEGKADWVAQLVKLKSEKLLVPSATAAANPRAFQAIERGLTK